MAEHSPRYDPSIRDELDKADWDSVFPAVLKYARWRAKKFKYLGYRVEPEELVHEAIARAYGVGTRGTNRNWNKDKYPKLEYFLIRNFRDAPKIISFYFRNVPLIPDSRYLPLGYNF